MTQHMIAPVAVPAIFHANGALGDTHNTAVHAAIEMTTNRITCSCSFGPIGTRFTLKPPLAPYSTLQSSLRPSGRVMFMLAISIPSKTSSVRPSATIKLIRAHNLRHKPPSKHSSLSKSPLDYPRSRRTRSDRILDTPQRLCKIPDHMPVRQDPM